MNRYTSSRFKTDYMNGTNGTVIDSYDYENFKNINRIKISFRCGEYEAGTLAEVQRMRRRLKLKDSITMLINKQEIYL